MNCIYVYINAKGEQIISTAIPEVMKAVIERHPELGPMRLFGRWRYKSVKYFK